MSGNSLLPYKFLRNSQKFIRQTGIPAHPWAAPSYSSQLSELTFEIFLQLQQTASWNISKTSDQLCSCLTIARWIIFKTSGAWSTLRGRLIKAKPALQFLLGRISVLDSFSCLLRFSLNVIRWLQKYHFQNLGPLLRFCRSLQRVLDQGEGRRHRHHDPKCVHVSRLYRLQSTTSWR